VCKRNLHTHFAVQTASRLSDPPNPLPEPKGSAIDRDTVLLNGGAVELLGDHKGELTIENSGAAGPGDVSEAGRRV